MSGGDTTGVRSESFQNIRILGRRRTFVIPISILAPFGIITLAARETHKIAGSVFDPIRTLTRFAEKGRAVRLRLRKNDQSPEIQDAFNRTADALHAGQVEGARRGAGPDRAGQAGRRGITRRGAPRELPATDIERLREEIEHR